MSRRLTALLLGVALLIGLAGGAAVLYWRARPAANVAVAGASKLGGPFALTDQFGHAVTDKDLRGKPSLVFFGFTYCPEVCPTTLTHMTAWMKALGPGADRLNVVYVTVDPERDTVAQMRSYLSAFDPRIRGLTGSTAAIAKVAGEYKVYFQKVAIEGGGYTVDHSSLIYVLDASGHVIGVIPYDETEASVMPKLRQLVAQ